MTVTDQDYIELLHRVGRMEARIDYLYKQLGYTYVPESQAGDDPRIVDLIKKGKMIDAMRVYREINGATLPEAKAAVEEIQGRLQL